MKKKCIMAVMLAVSLMVSSSAVAFAADSSTVEGPGWWVDGRTNSTAVALEDGATVTFDIVMDAPVSADDTYAATCVEVSDGTLYWTTTSDGDCWGYLDGTTEIGTVIKDTGKASMVRGGSYEVAVTRDGSNFTATYTDLSTGSAMFSTLYFMAGEGFEFKDPTVYVMGQVGNGTVTYTTSSADAAASTDTAASTDVPKTGVGSSALIFGLGALATGAVALKRKEK
jgi:hypothetical protein